MYLHPLRERYRFERIKLECFTDQIVTHGDETGTEVVWIHHAVSLLQRT